MSEYGYVVIKANENIDLCEVVTVKKDDYKLDLHDDLYKYTNCDCIQIVRSILPNTLMCLDDMGKIKGLNINLLATLLYGVERDFIVGDVVLGSSVGQSISDEPDIYAFTLEECATINAQLLDIVRRFKDFANHS